MKIGTTPTHVFVLPFPSELVEAVQITYQQGGKTILTLDETDCEIAGNKISAKLTQFNTFMFTGGVNVDIQIRVRTTDGNVLASNIMCVSCERCLSSEVI